MQDVITIFLFYILKVHRKDGCPVKKDGCPTENTHKKHSFYMIILRDSLYDETRKTEFG